ncbi:MAG TPA: transposase [Verrucomicrobiae bacterium]
MHRKSKREYLQELVAEKNRWTNRKLTDEERALGFLGWHERGYLPHCDFPNLIQFVTFRLDDSMPAARRSEWEHLLKIEDVRDRRKKLEEYLDRGHGNCVLRQPDIAAIAEAALLHFHNDRYELSAWCVMPNHLHVLVNVKMTPLWKMVQSWKVRIARESGKFQQLERRVPTRRVSNMTTNAPSRSSALRGFWEREYWDTFMRSEEQTRKAVHYIENNPVKAGFCRSTEKWHCSSARFRDEYRRLIAPPKEWK